jgi:hypothetical protein
MNFEFPVLGVMYITVAFGILITFAVIDYGSVEPSRVAVVNVVYADATAANP